MLCNFREIKKAMAFSWQNLEGFSSLLILFLFLFMLSQTFSMDPLQSLKNELDPFWQRLGWANNKASLLQPACLKLGKIQPPISGLMGR